MIPVRILPLVLLLAGCGPLWIAVAPGTPPMECTAVRLAARGWTVDTAYTDSLRIRVTRREDPYEYVTVGEILPSGGLYVSIDSDWFRVDVEPRDHIGSSWTTRWR